MPPIIPRASRGPSSSPLPSFRVSTEGGAQEAFGGGRAVSDTSELLRVADALWQRERDKVDTAAVLESENAAWEIEKELFHDPVNGAFTRRGKDALTASEEAMSTYRERLDELINGLSNERQRQAFRERSQSRRIALDGQAERYVAGQIREYTDAQTQAALDNITDQAALAFDDPEELAMLLEKKKGIISTYAGQFGITGEALERQQLVEGSKLHSVVMTRMLSKGLEDAAQAYLTEHTAELTSGDRAEIERQLKTATVEGEGMRGAGAVWQEMGPKSYNDPIRMADMEDAVRARFEGQPDTIRSAIQDLRMRATAFNEQQREVVASNSAAALGAFNNGMPLADVIRMPQYLALDGNDQQRIKSYMQDRNKTMSDRGREAQTRRGFAAYWKYSDAVTLDGLSENQILALEPELGQELTGRLMQQKRTMVRGDVRAASIDDDMFKHLLRQAGYDPTDEDLVADIGALKFAVENAIEREQQRRNGGLTRAEKTQLMQDIIHDQVKLEAFFIDPQQPLATTTPDEMGRAYVPLVDIKKRDPDWMQEAINWMRSEGLIMPRITDAQVGSLGIAHNIERAYVIRRTGGTRAEIEAALRGAP